MGRPERTGREVPHLEITAAYRTTCGTTANPSEFSQRNYGLAMAGKSGKVLELQANRGTARDFCLFTRTKSQIQILLPQLLFGYGHRGNNNTL